VISIYLDNLLDILPLYLRPKLIMYEIFKILIVKNVLIVTFLYLLIVRLIPKSAPVVFVLFVTVWKVGLKTMICSRFLTTSKHNEVSSTDDAVYIASKFGRCTVYIFQNNSIMFLSLDVL